MIKAVIFDMGRVLVPFDFQRGYERLAPLCKYTAAEIPSRLRSADLVSRFERGQIDAHAFVQEFSQALELDIKYEDFSEIWSSIFLPHTLIPESMLQGLRERYRLLLLSNTNALHWKWLQERYPMLNLFHERILSFEVGTMKPSPAIYEAAIAAANVKPHECFFTDDIAAYVEAAKSMGMDAVQFESADQIARELTARGVEWGGTV